MASEPKSSPAAKEGTDLTAGPAASYFIWSRSMFRIRIQEGKNGPQKYKKVEKFHALKCWIFSFEG
jgi:hypothetical protein